MERKELKEKAVTSVLWVLLSEVLQRFLNIGVRVVLARILFPDQFGLIASATVVIGSIKTFSNLGIPYAMVQRKDRVEDTGSTALVLLSFIATFNYLLAFFLAPYTAFFFRDERVELILKVLALSIFFNSAAIVPDAFLGREFKYKIRFYLDVICNIVSGSISIGLALFLSEEYRVWALVGGAISYDLTNAILVWKYIPYKLRLFFDWQIARDLFNYGKYFIGLSIVMYLYSNIDKFTVGRILGITALGYYSFAYNFTYKIVGIGLTVFSGVPLVVYSKLQDDVLSLRKAYFRTLKYASLLSAPLLLGAFIIAPEFIEVVFGSKWLPAVVPFQVLCIFTWIRSIDTTTGELYAGTGRPKLNQTMGIINLCGVAVTIYPLAKALGTTGVALSVTIGRLITLYFNFSKCAEVIECKITELFRVVFLTTSASFVMVAGVYLLKITLLQGVSMLNLLAMILGGAVIFLSVLFFINKELFFELKELLQVRFKKTA
ncbi:MAG: lipopolysaccharide biosynthesis protein [bacterium]|nr:lipopolysaccharide biosynthesis protein [bacterium]